MNGIQKKKLLSVYRKGKKLFFCHLVQVYLFRTQYEISVVKFNQSSV